jgi:hypothetical protein
VCWIIVALGSTMVLAGIVLLARFYAGRGVERPEVATVTRTEDMIVGALLVSLGLLLVALGGTGAVCLRLGIS